MLPRALSTENKWPFQRPCVFFVIFKKLAGFSIAFTVGPRAASNFVRNSFRLQATCFILISDTSNFVEFRCSLADVRQVVERDLVEVG